MGNSPPCASFARAEMGKLVLQSPLLRAIAVLDGSRVACSSLGHSMDKVDIGQPDFVSGRGVKVWSDVVLPAAPNLHYSALADGGYAIFLNRGDFLGAAELLAPHMTLGLAYPGTAAQFLGSGNVDPAWMEGLEDRVPVTEERAGAVVALTPSSKFSFFAMATLPKHAYLHDMALTRWIVGVTGALAGLLVFTVIFWQSRRALDLRTQLQRAIQNRDFYLAYQPIVDLRSGLGRRRGAVALAAAAGRRGDRRTSSFRPPNASACPETSPRWCSTWPARTSRSSPRRRRISMCR